jgi:hypothetical protein
MHTSTWSTSSGSDLEATRGTSFLYHHELQKSLSSQSDPEPCFYLSDLTNCKKVCSVNQFISVIQAEAPDNAINRINVDLVSDVSEIISVVFFRS